MSELWFDVGIKRYTTIKKITIMLISCGLMQESKDIQLAFIFKIFLLLWFDVGIKRYTT